MSTTEELLTHALDHVARDHGLPSLVVADERGLLVAAASQATERDAVAALAALRAAGDPARAEVASGRVKARPVPVGDAVLVVGALGDTAICGAAFDRVERVVQDALAR